MQNSVEMHLFLLLRNKMETTNSFLKFTVRTVFQTDISIKTLNINKEMIFDYEHAFESEQPYFGSITKMSLIALFL